MPPLVLQMLPSGCSSTTLATVLTGQVHFFIRRLNSWGGIILFVCKTVILSASKRSCCEASMGAFHTETLKKIILLTRYSKKTTHLQFPYIKAATVGTGGSALVAEEDAFWGSAPGGL